MLMEKRLWCFGLALVCLLGPLSARAQQLSPNMPVDVSNLPHPLATDWNAFAWQSFIASNWPVAKGTRGVPDSIRAIGATDAGMPVPVLWMTSKGISDVFLPKGAPPNGNWQTQVPIAACQSVPGYDSATSYVLGMISKTSPVAYTELNQAPFPGSKQVVGPVIDQLGNYVRYDIRMSQSEFGYFMNFQYYNAANQIAAVTSNPITFKAPPTSGQESYLNLPPYARYGAIEYKASWRLLDPSVDAVSRYFTTMAFIVNPDGKCEGPQLVGLTGLHILRLTPSTPTTWFWSTFEQVDNLTVPNPPPLRPDGKPLTPSFGDGKTRVTGYSYTPAIITPGAPLPRQPPVGVSRVTPIQDTSIPVTNSYQQLLKGTRWENYQLIGVQFPVNALKNGEPQGDANGTGHCFVAGNNHDTMPKFQLNDCYLANVSMETYVQSTSCATCHSYAAPLGVPRTSTGRPTFDALNNFQIFTFMLFQAQAPN
jgi:hypothetical protein